MSLQCVFMLKRKMHNWSVIVAGKETDFCLLPTTTTINQPWHSCCCATHTHLQMNNMDVFFQTIQITENPFASHGQRRQNN